MESEQRPSKAWVEGSSPSWGTSYSIINLYNMNEEANPPVNIIEFSLSLMDKMISPSLSSVKAMTEEEYAEWAKHHVTTEKDINGHEHTVLHCDPID